MKYGLRVEVPSLRPPTILIRSVPSNLALFSNTDGADRLNMYSVSNHTDATDTYSGSNSGKLLSHSIFSVNVSVAISITSV